MSEIVLPFGFWYESPSTFTFIFWIVLWLSGLHKLPISAYSDIKRIPFLYRLVNCIMIVGFVAFIYDTQWIILQSIKFGYLFPDDQWELVLRLVQNIGFYIVCYIFIKHLFDKGILEFHVLTYDLLLIQLVYFIVWFYFAPDPSWTDWTYAIRNNFSGNRVIMSFTISHILGKFLQGRIFFSLWKKNGMKNK